MKKILITFLLCSIVTCSWASSFVVKRINIVGLQRISPDTVYSYLPIKTGQTLRSDRTGQIITSLYKTGFFEHISLARNGNTLIINVMERPTIGQLKISGNSAIPTDKLTAVMNSVDIAEGRAYNDVVLEKIKQSLLNEYYQLGRYNARVDVTVTPMPRNRVLIKIEISEGLVAKVRKINIIGNHAFSERELEKQLELSTPGLLTFYTQKDRYSQEKLDQSLEKIRNYYLDHGYIKVAVKSSQAAVAPDRKSIYLTIVIDEGVPYYVKGYQLLGETIVPRDVLMQKIHIVPGAPFSRQAVIDSEKAMSDTLGDQGYLFAVVSIQPKVDEIHKQVYLTFTVRPGRRAYVRHIYFSNNSKTNDEALRREVQQMEAAPVSTTRLDQSKQGISLLPFIKNVDMSVEPVPNTDDMVDVNYKVTEDNSAQANFSVGYSQLDHFILGAGVNQKNFLGTGKTLGLNFTHSRYQTYYGINYTDPYYTNEGISRSINLSISKFDPAAANVTHSYTSDQYDLSVVYGIPIGNFSSGKTFLQLGYGLERTIIHPTNTIATQYQSFINRHGTDYQQFDLITGLSRDTRDKAIFPTRGALNTLAANLYAPLSGNSLKYYTVDYSTHWYQPIRGPFILSARGNIGYGNAFSGPQDFPFFKDFYAGGPDSVWGYDANTLGPTDSNGDPTGGNLLVTAGLSLIFPNYISDNLRTSFLVDGGNVYNTFNNRVYSCNNPAPGQKLICPGPSGPIRYSAGLEADWLTPLGLVGVVVAQALNPQHGDSTTHFQLSLGANFG